MPNKNTPNGQLFEQYQREYRRIIDAIRENKKLGYILPEEYKPIKPSKIKNLTQEIVREMSNTAPSDLRLKSLYVDKSSGMVYEGVDHVVSHHKAKPSKAKVKEFKGRYKNTFTQKYDKTLHNSFDRPEDSIPPSDSSLNLDIINEVNAILENFEPPQNRTQSFVFRKTTNFHKVEFIWKETLYREGEYEVAYRLEGHAQEFIDLINKLLYDSDSKNDDEFCMSQFVTLLTSQALTASESDYYDSEAAYRATDTLRGLGR